MATKKAVSKKAPAKKTVAKKTSAKKAKTAAKKTAAKKVPAKKTVAKKTVAKKAPAKSSAAKKTTGKSVSKKANPGTKYAPAAHANVEREMKAMKQGKLRSGSGQKVTNPKQAIAIALSEERRAGADVPPNPNESK